MKALVYKGPNTISLEDAADPAIGANDVCIRVRFCGICGSDVHGYMGITGRRNPGLIMGHEFSGEVESVGRCVKSCTVGDRVTAFPLIYCGECAMCTRHRENLCMNRSFLGLFSWNGAMAERVVAPERCVVKLPRLMSFQMGALVEPYAVACRAVARANIRPGQSVFIVGAGTIGLMTLINARSQNPRGILASDLDENRLALARKLGAHTVNPGDEDVSEAIGNAFGTRRVDASIEAVGVSQALRQALEALRDGGVCVCIGNTRTEAAIPLQSVVTRELEIRGTHVYTLREFKEACRLMEENAALLSQLISCECKPGEAQEYFRRLSQGDERLVKVLIDFSPPI